jgi:hypothetical protein
MKFDPWFRLLLFGFTSKLYAEVSPSGLADADKFRGRSHLAGPRPVRVGHRCQSIPEEPVILHCKPKEELGILPDSQDAYGVLFADRLTRVGSFR